MDTKSSKNPLKLTLGEILKLVEQLGGYGAVKNLIFTYNSEPKSPFEDYPLSDLVEVIAIVCGVTDNSSDVLSKLVTRELGLNIQTSRGPIFNKNGHFIPVQKGLSLPNNPYFKFQSIRLTNKEKYDLALDAFEHFIKISFVEFNDKVQKLTQNLKNHVRVKGILNGPCLPFILPKIPEGDYGAVLSKIFIPTLMRMVTKRFEWLNCLKLEDWLEEEISITPGSLHDELLQRASENGNLVGLYFPSFPGFWPDSLHEVIKYLPENFMIAGGVDTLTALTCNITFLEQHPKLPKINFSGIQYGPHKESIGLTRFYEQVAIKIDRPTEKTLPFQTSGLVYIGD